MHFSMHLSDFYSSLFLFFFLFLFDIDLLAGARHYVYCNVCWQIPIKAI